MRLVDLDPKWIGYGGKGITDADGNPVPERKGIAVYFNCPCGCNHPVSVSFKNPLDGGPPPIPERTYWQRTGDTFETLTLTPSILRLSGCRWHGFITNGEIVNA